MSLNVAAMADGSLDYYRCDGYWLNLLPMRSQRHDFVVSIDVRLNPFLRWSYRVLLAFRVMCIEWNLDHSICPSLVRPAPNEWMKGWRVFIGVTVVSPLPLQQINILTRPTRLSADPMTSNEFGRFCSCGLPGVERETMLTPAIPLPPGIILPLISRCCGGWLCWSVWWWGCCWSGPIAFVLELNEINQFVSMNIDFI